VALVWTALLWLAVLWFPMGSHLLMWPTSALIAAGWVIQFKSRASDSFWCLFAMWACSVITVVLYLPTLIQISTAGAMLMAPVIVVATALVVTQLAGSLVLTHRSALPLIAVVALCVAIALETNG